MLRGTDGTLLTVKAGLEVRNVAQIRAGNQVVIRYVEALAARLAPSYPTASRSALGSASPPPRLPR